MVWIANCEIIEPNIVKREKSEEEVLRRTASEISKFCYGKKDILFIVNDDQRPTPTAKILEKLDERILEKAEFLIATGTHNPPSEEGMRFIFGRKYPELKERIIVHDAYKNCSYVGKTRFGNSVYLDNKFLERENIVIITSVEPHYFAGYTGGRKSILPGVAAYETIERNHKLALSENARPLALEGNPVHEEMEDCLRLVRDKDIFGVNCVLDKDHQIFSIKTGDLEESFRRAVKDAEKIFAVRLKEKADIVITQARPPLDITLYQAHKAIEHGKLALKEGGIIILVAECKQGIGNRTFYDLLRNREPEEVIKTVKKNYKLGYHKAARLAQLMLHSEIYAVTSLEDKVLEDINIKPFRTLEEAYQKAREKMGSKAKAIYLTDGAVTVPIVED